jgi:hypothetical protein
MNKNEILNLAKEKGIKLTYLSELIGGYRGKLTEWKNGKTTLSEREEKIITDYLLGLPPTPELSIEEQKIITAYRNQAPEAKALIKKALGIKDDNK